MPRLKSTFMPSPKCSFHPLDLKKCIHFSSVPTIAFSTKQDFLRVNAFSHVQIDLVMGSIWVSFTFLPVNFASWMIFLPNNCLPNSRRAHWCQTLFVAVINSWLSMTSEVIYLLEVSNQIRSILLGVWSHMIL